MSSVREEYPGYLPWSGYTTMERRGGCRPEKRLCKSVQGNLNTQGLSKREVWSTGVASEVCGEQGKETLRTWVWGRGLEVRLQ